MLLCSSLQSERFDKMEKADILEMTVNCVRQLQRQASSGKTVDIITSLLITVDFCAHRPSDLKVINDLGLITAPIKLTTFNKNMG